MPTVRPFRGDGFLFPPPPKREGTIVCLVVEKKGDETRTSMRQSEIYAFSSEIIIRDGYMVMPKICWSAYNPGDWFICDRDFSVDRHGNQKEERELINLHKIDQNSHKDYNIPPTRFEHGYVQVILPFVLCPEFIRNKEIRNAFGVYRKLYLLNMGQGFVHNVNEKCWKKLAPGRVYKGIFEFRAKDNGAVNFGHRSEVRDQTGHVLERDAMWELVQLLSMDSNRKVQDIPIAEHQAMKDDLEDLLDYAGKYEEEIVAKGFYGPPPPRMEPEISLMPPPPQQPKLQKAVTSGYNIAREDSGPVRPHRSRGNPRADQLIQELAKLKIESGATQLAMNRTMAPQAAAPASSNTHARASSLPRNAARDSSLSRLAPAPTPPGPPSGGHVARRFANGPRERTLRQSHTDTLQNDDTLSVSEVFFSHDRRTSFPQPVEVIITNHQQLEEHRARVIMRSSFQEPNGTLIQKWIDRETNETSTSDDILNFKFDARHGAHDDPPFGQAVAYFAELEHHRQLTDLSFFSNTTAAERPPLASSTPLGSPEAPRRRFQSTGSRGSMAPSANVTLRRAMPPPPPPTIRNQATIDDDTDATGTLIELRRDNNANPRRARNPTLYRH